MGRRHLLIMFAKAPVPGRVKTRLQPSFTPRQSASLHASFLLDLAEHLLAAGPRWDAWLSVAGEMAHPVVEEIGAMGVTLVPQGGTSLGDRMATAIEQGLDAGYETVTIIGSDAPTLSVAMVEGAIAALEGEGGCHAALTPTFDGGFALISARCPLPALRASIPWSQDVTLVATLDALRADKMMAALTGFWYDVDEAQDVSFLARHLLGAQSDALMRAATRTASWLREQGLDTWGQRGTRPDDTDSAKD